MAKTSLILAIIILFTIAATSEAFVRHKRSEATEEVKAEDAPIKQEDKVIQEEHQKGDSSIQEQARRKRQWQNYDSTLREIFVLPQTSPNNYGRVERNIYPNSNPYPNLFFQPQAYNKFPVYGPPSYQPNNFYSPFINNHYLPVPPYFVSYCPIYINIPHVPQRPQIPPQIPTDDDNYDPNEVPATVDLDTKFSETNETGTGISLIPMKPARPPSITPPPIQRPQGSRPRPPQGPMEQLPPRPIFQSPQRPRPTQRPSNSFRPDNSVNSNYPIYYPEDNYNDFIPDQGPSPCVRAIVWCCIPNLSRTMSRDRCFEINGCPGASFDSDPCETRLAMEAIRAANQYNRRV